jgi:replicative DNA helicase
MCQHRLGRSRKLSEQNTPPSDDNTSPEWEHIESLQNYLAKVVRQHDGGKDVHPEKVLSELQKLIDGKPKDKTKAQVDIASGEIDYWGHVAKRKQTVETGLGSLNSILGGGLEAGRLMVLLGAPGGGKTTLANQIAVHVANKGRPVLYVTSEDVPFNLLAKTLSRQGKIDYTSVLKGKDTEREQITNVLRAYQMSQAAQRLRYLDATLMVEMSAIREAAQAHFEKYKDAGQGILILDYLQRFARGQASYRNGGGDLRLAVTGLTEQLRGLATGLDCCVIALASQNRSGIGANNALTSAKESGDIEYTADVLMAIDDDEERPPTAPALVSKRLKVDKNRQGATGQLPLDWYPEYQQFTEVDKENVSYTNSASNGKGRRGR